MSHCGDSLIKMQTVWDDEQEKAFQKMKELAKFDQVLGYYDPKKPDICTYRWSRRSDDAKY